MLLLSEKGSSVVMLKSQIEMNELRPARQVPVL